MELQLVSKETAILAKELGFDWSVERFYRKYILDKEEYSISKVDGDKFNANEYNSISMPEQELLAKWLRDIHKIRVLIVQGSSGGFKFEIYLWNKPNNIGKWSRVGSITSSFSYEETMEQGLITGLNLLKDAKERSKSLEL